MHHESAKVTSTRTTAIGSLSQRINQSARSCPRRDSALSVSWKARRRPALAGAHTSKVEMLPANRRVWRRFSTATRRRWMSGLLVHLSAARLWPLLCVPAKPTRTHATKPTGLCTSAAARLPLLRPLPQSSLPQALLAPCAACPAARTQPPPSPCLEQHPPKAPHFSSLFACLSRVVASQ